MKLIVTRITSGFDRFNGFLTIIAAVLSVLIMLAVTITVVTRYFFDFVPKGWFELWEYSIVYITFLGSAWLLNREGHVVMDVVTSHLKPKAQNILNIVSSILGAMGCLALTYWGILVTVESGLAGHLELYGELYPPEWTILWIIPFGSLLLSIQFMRRIYRYSTGRGAAAGAAKLMD